MTAYALTNIYKEFQGRRVLDISSLTVAVGKVYSLIGPNGAGKTTLLNILAFLSEPSGGALNFSGRPVRYDRSSLQSLRKKVVLVNQHPLLFTTSVFNNVAFGLKTRKIPSKKRAAIIEQVLYQVGMSRFIHADARHLSGGETRRIAIARALACNPEVLLLDEPTTDLDVENRNAVEAIIADIAKQNRMTLIFCTHDHDQAARLTSRTIRLLEGRLTDFIHENIFRGNVVTETQQFFCRVADHIRIPVPPTNQRNMRISIHPKSIEIVDIVPTDRQTAGDPTVVFPGKIIALGDAGPDIRVRVDIGITLQLLMGKKEYAARSIRIGDPIAIRIDPDRVTCMEGLFHP
jgi:tungstate transport system ATP-binding protein